MKIELRDNIKSIILLLITFLIFFIIFTKIDLSKTIGILTKTNLLLFILAILISIIANIFICAHRWFLVVKELSNISFKEIIFVRTGCIPLCTILPARSGELLKAVYLKKNKKIRFRIGTSSLLFNGLVDIIALVIIFFVGIVLAHIYSPNLFTKSIFILFIPILIYIFWKINPTRKIILKLLKKNDNKFHDIVQGVMISFEQISLKKTFMLVIYAIFFNLFFVSIYKILFLSLNVSVPFTNILVFMPLILLISQIPITVSGFGTRETAIIILFSNFANAETLLSIGLLVSFVIYIFPALIGLFFVRSFMRLL